MKIAVTNLSGNVGKTTVAQHVFLPRIADAKLISVESANADQDSKNTMRGKEYGELQDELAFLENIVVDIGASNAEDFVKLMAQYQGSHEDYDLFVIPVVGVEKQVRDTINTVETLAQMGVPPKKIVIVRNRVELLDEPMKRFEPLAEYTAAENKCVMPVRAYLNDNEIYSRVKGTGINIMEAAADKTDYNAKIASAKTETEKRELVNCRGIKRLAGAVVVEHDRVFQAITGKRTSRAAA